MKFCPGFLSDLVEILNRRSTALEHCGTIFRVHFIAIDASKSHLFIVEDLCFLLVMLREGRKVTSVSKLLEQFNMVFLVNFCACLDL